jgi:GNAT superfamily N-acetyltransferase
MSMANITPGITYTTQTYIFLIQPVNSNIQLFFNIRLELKNLFHYLTNIEIQIVLNWLNEKDALFARLYDKDTNDIICFALVHKLDFDPYRKHKRPSYIDFIFTIPKFRRNGAASNLLKQLLNTKLELTASVNISESLKLFNKANFKCSGKTNECLILQS